MKWLFKAIVMILCLALTLGVVGCGSSAAKDTTPPSTPAGISRTTLDNDNTPTFTWDAATDVGSGIDYYLVSIDGGDWIGAGNIHTTYTVDSGLTDGSHTFEVKAVDKAGNEGSAAAVTFMVAVAASHVVELSLQILSVTSPVSPGGYATLDAKTEPGAQCIIDVYYMSGPSTAQGLYDKTADADGNVSWTWKVGTRTTAGSWKIVVSASLGGKTASQATYFTVR